MRRASGAGRRCRSGGPASAGRQRIYSREGTLGGRPARGSAAAASPSGMARPMALGGRYGPRGEVRIQLEGKAPKTRLRHEAGVWVPTPCGVSLVVPAWRTDRRWSAHRPMNRLFGFGVSRRGIAPNRLAGSNRAEEPATANWLKRVRWSRRLRSLEAAGQDEDAFRRWATPCSMAFARMSTVLKPSARACLHQGERYGTVARMENARAFSKTKASALDSSTQGARTRPQDRVDRPPEPRPEALARSTSRP